MEYVVTNPLSIQLLQLFKNLSDNGVTHIFCATESTKKVDIPKPKWTGFTKISNIDDEDKARIQFLCNVLEPGLWNKVTFDTYIPLEEADVETYPENATFTTTSISRFINGEVITEEILGYVCDDVLYLPYEETK